MNTKNMISHMAKPTLTNKQQLFLQQFHTSRTQKFYQTKQKCNVLNMYKHDGSLKICIMHNSYNKTTKQKATTLCTVNTWL